MQNKTVLVIGGSRGIGFGIVERCLSAGAQVIAASRSLGQLERVPGVRHVQYDALAGPLDTSILPDCLDGFVYCPGSINLGTLRSVTAASLRSDFELNVVGAVQALQSVLPFLKKAETSSAVFFSTVAVTQGLAMHSSVAAVKGAIEALVRTWANELSPTIRVNCIAPALTDTPLAERLLSSDEKRQSMASRYPLGRIGTVDDMAAAAVFLLSKDSSWMTGQVLHIDGGMSTLGK